jgi:zinc/manganese transport system substrate-binding protein
MRVIAGLSLAVLALALAGCGSPTSTAGGRLRVVAAENFWGSIAAQLGGDRVAVTSIVVNPATDPHSYEATPSDARAMAGAKVAIVNGIGYDNWASQLLDANPVSGRISVTVGDVLRLHEGDNPHQWYSPPNVRRVIAAIVAAYDKADPADTAYFRTREHAFETTGLARYDELLAEIRSRYAGAPVGYSESIFQPLGTYLGLKLMTPYSFAKAVAEGSDVSAQDVETVERQAQSHQIDVWVYNSQNVTPEVSRVTAIARAAHIPVVTVTETLSPASLDFEQWQARELSALLTALHRATGQ